MINVGNETGVELPIDLIDMLSRFMNRPVGHCRGQAYEYCLAERLKFFDTEFFQHPENLFLDSA